MAEIRKKVVATAEIHEKVVAMAEIPKEGDRYGWKFIKKWSRWLKFFKKVVALAENR